MDKDKKLVELYLTRDKSAVEQTARQYGKRLMGLAKSFLKDPRDAEECVNDTYMKAWESIPPHEPRDLFAYLARLCRCTACNIIEKQQAAKRSAQLVELTQELEECIPDRSRTAEPDYGEVTQLINDYLSTLPADRRDIFVKRYWFGLPLKQIASDMGFTLSKVKTSLSRTREGLRKYLEQKGVQP